MTDELNDLAIDLQIFCAILKQVSTVFLILPSIHENTMKDNIVVINFVFILALLMFSGLNYAHVYVLLLSGRMNFFPKDLPFQTVSRVTLFSALTLHCLPFVLVM